MKSSDTGKEVIKKELPLIPKLPGVYRMLNLKNEILYVGKAKNLPNRLKNYISEKTNWQKMLKDERNNEIDLLDAKDDLINYLPESLQNFICDDDDVYELFYPIENYPTKVKSLNFDKTPNIGGKLIGIRAQYLIFDTGEVINLRKFTGYNVSLTVHDMIKRAEQKTLF